MWSLTNENMNAFKSVIIYHRINTLNLKLRKLRNDHAFARSSLISKSNSKKVLLIFRRNRIWFLVSVTFTANKNIPLRHFI